MERMRLRSSIPPEEREKRKREDEIQKEAYKNRPYIGYSGKVKYCTTLIDCAMACDKLLKLAVECEDELFVVGFDMEWPFNFVDGAGKTAVIQISSSLTECIILHVSALKTVPKSLIEFLKHPKVRLAGVNIKNDIRKLARDFKGITADEILVNCVDSGVQANSVLPVQQRWSMEKLVDYCFKMRINKDKKVRNSKWHIVPLSKEQQVYAAIDAYVSLKLYHHLKEVEKQMDVEQNEKENLLFHNL